MLSQEQINDYASRIETILFQFRDEPAQEEAIRKKFSELEGEDISDPDLKEVLSSRPKMFVKTENGWLPASNDQRHIRDLMIMAEEDKKKKESNSSRVPLRYRLSRTFGQTCHPNSAVSDLMKMAEREKNKESKSSLVPVRERLSWAKTSRPTSQPYSAVPDLMKMAEREKNKESKPSRVPVTERLSTWKTFRPTPQPNSTVLGFLKMVEEEKKKSRVSVRERLSTLKTFRPTSQPDSAVPGSSTDFRRPDSSSHELKQVNENQEELEFIRHFGFFVAVRKDISQFYDVNKTKVFELPTLKHYKLGYCFNGEPGQNLSRVNPENPRFTLETENGKTIVRTIIVAPNRETAVRELKESGIFAGKFEFVRDDDNLMADKPKNVSYEAELEYQPKDGKFFNIRQVFEKSNYQLKMFWQRAKNVNPPQQQEPKEENKFIALVIASGVKTETANISNYLYSERYGLQPALEGLNGRATNTPIELGKFYSCGFRIRHERSRLTSPVEITLRQFETEVTYDGLVEVKLVDGFFDVIISLDNLRKNWNHIKMPIFGSVKIEKEPRRELLKKARHDTRRFCRVAGTLRSIARPHMQKNHRDPYFTLTDISNVQFVDDSRQSSKRRGYDNNPSSSNDDFRAKRIRYSNY